MVFSLKSSIVKLSYSELAIKYIHVDYPRPFEKSVSATRDTNIYY